MESNMQQLLAELDAIERVVSHVEVAVVDGAQTAVSGAHNACQVSRDTRQRAAALRREAHRMREISAFARRET